MLKYVSIVLIFIFLVSSCKQNLSHSDDFYKKSLSRVEQVQYYNVYNNIRDSLDNWKKHQIENWLDLGSFKYYLDSTLCFNKDGDRVIGSVHIVKDVPCSNSDGLREILGEKINGCWYFFGSSYTIIPREKYSSNTDVALGYKQLHDASIKYLFSNYLLRSDEEWFNSTFEGPGWGSLETQEYDDWCFKGKRYTDLKEYYKAVHICAAKSIWRDRDTSKKELP